MCSNFQLNMEQTIILSATISLLIFGIIGIIDGFYYHLWKFNLYKHKETRFEHITHTIRAFLFLGMLFLFFINDYGGKLFLLGVLFVIIDLIVLIIDLIAEENSREKLGGLPHIEYIVHVIANALHFTAIALILVAKPLEYWNYNSTTILNRNFPELTHLIAVNLALGVFLLAILHILLMNKRIGKLFEKLIPNKN